MIRPGQTRDLKMRLVNAYKYQTMLNIHWYLPEGLVVENGIDATVSVLQPHFAEPPVINWRIRGDAVKAPVLLRGRGVHPARAGVGNARAGNVHPHGGVTVMRARQRFIARWPP